LSLLGLGFAFMAIQINMQKPNSPISKSHIIAISLGLAFWLFVLARPDQAITDKLKKE